MPKSSEESASPASIFSMVPTMASRLALSRPSSWAFFESSQTFGSSSARATSIRRLFLAS
jgi:hypothetical protein